MIYKMNLCYIPKAIRISQLAMVISICTLNFSSCATLHVLPEKEITTSVLDISKYAEAGFLITPYQYGGDHVVLGQISVVGKNGLTEVTTASYDPVTRTDVQSYRVLQDDISYYTVLDSVVSIARRMDADGLTGFKSSIASRRLE